MRLVGARIFLAEDQEHLDRLLDAKSRENAPLVDKIIICDERALFLYDDPRIELFGSLAAKGGELPAAMAQVIELESKVRSDDTSAIISLRHYRISKGSLSHAKRGHHWFRIELFSR